MKIAFVDQCGAKPGGAEESLFLLLTNLPPDVEPVVILYEHGEFEDRLRAAGFRTVVVAVAMLVRSVQRERLTMRAALGVPSVVRSLAAALRRERVDLVHTNSVKAHVMAALAARLAGVPCVMHLRDMVEGAGRTALRSIALTCSRERIAISRAVAGWYRLPKTTVIANPVDLSSYVSLPSPAAARRQLGIPVDGLPLAGIVGRINRWKGHDTFLRAIAQANRRVAVRCAVIGEARFRDADFVPQLERLARELGLAERMHFVPWVNDPRVAYAALDIHCNCSLREPFGRTIVEAAAAGVPTIAFDDGGAGDIIEHGEDGLLIPAGDERRFSEALIRLAGDPAARARMGAAARGKSRRYEAHAHADRVIGVLRRACA
jgi:glycosyltransferase involved in cell wall biosynthesis